MNKDVCWQYFKVLNEKYHKGIIDPESFTNTYEEYLTKLSSGAVLGMVDQWWQFAYGIAPAYERQGLELQGCSYVPLPITIDGSVKNQWNVKRSNELDIATGVAITKSCDDIAGALQFINDLLEPDTQILRFWGIEGEDYEVDENGYFYRTQEQREKQNQTEYINSYYCSYSYFPRLEGMSADGKNYFAPEYQPDEFHATLPTDVKECLDAYGCKTYVDMIGSNEQPGEWYPMYSYSSMLTTATEAGVVWKNMTETKQELLPRVVMADDFEAMWNEYIDRKSVV